MEDKLETIIFSSGYKDASYINLCLERLVGHKVKIVEEKPEKFVILQRSKGFAGVLIENGEKIKIVKFGEPEEEDTIDQISDEILDSYELESGKIIIITDSALISVVKGEMKVS